MKLKFLLFAILSLLTLGISACGSDADGLNGAIEVEAGAVGSVISATATYTNPTETNLIGTNISFSYQVGNGPLLDLGTYGTNNSGSVGVSFTPANFSGTRTITVFARTGNLTNFESFSMTGSTLAVTPPAAVSATAVNAASAQETITIPLAANFVSITDPFAGDISGHTLTITPSVTSSVATDEVVLTADTVITDVSGRASFPGATVTMEVPAAGTSRSMTITWTIKDETTDQTGVATTIVTLTTPAATPAATP